jgi:hypothetical protein
MQLRSPPKTRASTELPVAGKVTLKDENQIVSHTSRGDLVWAVGLSSNKNFQIQLDLMIKTFKPSP